MKVWRKALSLQQEEAAARLGLSASTYQNYERGTRRPDTDGMEALVRGGINANWLLTGEGSMLLDQDAQSQQMQLQGSQAQYKVEEPAPGSQGMAAGVDFGLMRLCLGACQMVHGKEFTAEPPALQLEYACEFYNLLIKQATAHGQGLKAGIAAFMSLDTRGLAAQLRIYLSTKVARPYGNDKPTPQPDRKVEPGTESWSW